MHSDPRPGFKLIELLVLIFILGILMAILLPELNSRSGCGRREQCQNNLRQIGLGLLGYANTYGSFPNAGTFFDDPTIHQGDPTKSNIYRTLYDPGAVDGTPAPWLRSWIVDILPYIDSQELYNGWNKDQSYLSSDLSQGRPSNLEIASTAIGILRCPDDNTTVPNAGNLSYAVNGGFARWYPDPVSWTGSKTDGQPKNGDVLRWVAPEADWTQGQAVGKKLGVLFLATHTGDQPWDIKITPTDIADGASSTLLVGENTLVGYSKGTPYSGGQPTNWACPLPNFSMFLASDDVCHLGGSATDCLGGLLAIQPHNLDGPNWALANKEGTFENMNFGVALTVEGSFPFVSSAHPGGANFVFCDGAVRFVKSTIAGTVYAKLITPAGSKLPAEIQQAGLSQDDFAQ
ncbi:DUF1559 family PulG-like putative transporter [Singulisphaera rosea]